MKGRKSSKEAEGNTGLPGIRIIIGTNLALALLAIAVVCVSVTAQEDTADYWLEKAYELSTNGSYEEALLAYDRVLEMDPENYTAIINKGHLD
jgi:tetratricopeptide (TPR) repeat protein